MGKAQSKRSVDITTDPKKDGIIEEGTGELKKIEDVDQLKPQVNGDTHHNENEEKDKIAETGETENEKDLSTEKEQSSTIDAKAQVEGAGDAAQSAVVISENGGDELLDESKNDADGTPTTDTSTATAETPDSSKKPKKEKMKKKWSFRSISFGKKDKQKPSKKDDANASAVNGECEKVPEETTEEPAGEKKDETTTVATSNAATDTPAVSDEPAATVATPETPKEETVTTATAVTGEKPTEISVGADGDIAAPITNGTTTATTPKSETKIDEITESLGAVNINEKIDENNEKITVPELKKTEDEELTAPAPVSSVVEEVITTNGDNHNDDIKINGDNNDVATVEATITNESVVVSSPKLNGSHESPKIEVKEDIIETTTKNILLSNQDNQKIIEAVIVNNNSSINENIIVAQNDNNNKEPLPLSISSPPPPLPCSPPPSQVMVFALSDNKNSTTEKGQQTTNEKEQQTTAEDIDMNQHQQENEKSNDSINIVYEKLATSIEECLPTPQSILPEEVINQIENIKEIDCKLPVTPQQIEQKLPEIEPVIQEQNLKTIEEIPNNQVQQDEIQVDEQKSDILEEKLNKNEIIIPENVNISVLTTSINSEIVNNPIDISTKIIQQIDIEQHSSQIPDVQLSKNEVIIPEINEIETSQKELKPETITNNEFNDNNDLPTPPPSPIPEMHNDKIDVTTAVDEINKNVETDTSLDLDKMTGSNEILLITAEQGVQVNDGDVSPHQQEQQQQQQEQQLHQNKQKQQHKRNKENGVGDNHDETTATDSLNGVEHKTIEEIKAENQQIEKIVPTEVTQESAKVAE